MGEPANVWFLPEVMKMEQDAELLPIARLYGKNFLIDVSRRQFRNFNDPDVVVGMHTDRGRKMVMDMQGLEFNSSGISTGVTQDIVV